MSFRYRMRIILVHSSIVLFLVNSCTTNPKQATLTFLYNRFLAPAKEKSVKEAAWAEIQYYAGAKHRRALQRLNSPNEIDNYLFNFWQAFDPTPRTSRNEFRIEHLKRMKYVDSHYPDSRGWGSSDRGRVYILYGPPAEIMNEPYLESEIYKSMEIWLYNKASVGNNSFQGLPYPIGQMSFFFAETQYLGKYTQIYSSEEGEVCDPRLLDYDPPRPGIELGF